MKITVDQWVEALESGKYAKGTESLRRNAYGDGYEYCCLGVLCEVGTRDGLSVDGHPLAKSWRLTEPVEINDDDVCITMEDSACWLNPDIIPPKIQWELADKNDAAETFEPVINLIREIFPDGSQLIGR